MSLLAASPFNRIWHSGWTYMLGGLVAGGVHAAAWAYMSHSALIEIAALVVLVLLLAKAPTFWKACLTGWAFALTWLSGSVWWLYISMHQYGGMPAIMAGAAVILLCAGLALIYGAALGIVYKATPTHPVKRVNPLIFACGWLLADLVRGWLFTGFPWAACGYAHVDGWLQVYAPWVGVYGVGALAALLAACVAAVGLYGLSYKSEQKVVSTRCALASLLALVVTVGACWPLQRDFTQPVGEIKVALLQGNIAQDLKFDEVTMQQALYWYLGEIIKARQQEVDLVVAPETAIPTFPQYLPKGMWASFKSKFASGSTATLFGIPMLNAQGAVTNSMVAFVPGQEVYQYDKHHLVPFGEFIPFGFRWFVDMMHIPLGDMAAGAVNSESLLWQGQSIAPNICYEDLFGEEIARRFSNAQHAPTIMANASNIAWFGDTVAIPQHLQIARMRALEFQRPMIRATNTGATAIIDHCGQVQQMLPPYTRGVLLGNVQGRTGLTPYAWWASRWGLLPLWILGISLLTFFLILRRKSV